MENRKQQLQISMEEREKEIEVHTEAEPVEGHLHEFICNKRAVYMLLYPFHLIYNYDTIGYKPLRAVYEVLRAQIRAAEEEKHKATAS